MSLPRPIRPALALLLVGALAGCATSGVNQGDFNLVGLQEEWQLGQKLEQDLAGQLRLVRDRAALDYLNQVGRRLVGQTEMANLPWEFHLVDDPEVNAFNIPGGHVYVNTGLVQAADSAAELAGVLAHEISHGVARHGTEQLSKAYGLNIVAGLALGENPQVYQQLLAQIVAGGSMAHFSRGAEREADALGVRTMYRAGYEPRGMLGIFQELLQQRRRRPGAVEQFFATHPLTENRLADIERIIEQELPPKRGLITNQPGFSSLQRVAR